MRAKHGNDHLECRKDGALFHLKLFSSARRSPAAVGLVAVAYGALTPLGVGSRVYRTRRAALNGLPNSEWGDAVTSSRVLRAVVSVGLVGVIGVSGCGGSAKKKKAKPVDPVTMALMAPGVRTVLIPKQSTALTIVVPPCGLAKTTQNTTRTPPGSNQIVVPTSALDQTVAINPCMQGAKSAKSSTVLLSPGGASSAASQKTKPPNQLILPKNSNITKLIVPPCVVMSSSGGPPPPKGGPNTVLPGTQRKGSVTAPACTVQMTSSS